MTTSPPSSTFFRRAARACGRSRGSALEVELVVCIGRGPPEKLAPQAPRIAALRHAGLIRGVALAGLEAKFPVRPLARFIDEFRDLGLGIEIHAGELAGTESVRDALQYGRPERLGHAIAAFHIGAARESAERGIISILPSSTSVGNAMSAIGGIRSAGSRARVSFTSTPMTGRGCP